MLFWVSVIFSAQSSDQLRRQLALITRLAGKTTCPKIIHAQSQMLKTYNYCYQSAGLLYVAQQKYNTLTTRKYKQESPAIAD